MTAYGRFGGALALLAVSALAVSLGGCSYLLGDRYTNGGVIQRASAWTDLDAAFGAAGASPVSNSVALFQFDSPVRSSILAMTSFQDAAGNWSSYALMLDPESLAKVGVLSAQVATGGACGVDVSGNYRIGDKTFLASDFSPDPGTPLIAFSGFDTRMPGIFPNDGSGSNCYLFWIGSPNVLNVYRCGLSYGLSPTLTAQPMGFSSPFPGDGWSVLDVQYLSGAGKPLKLLLVNGSTFYCAGFDSMAQLQTLPAIYAAANVERCSGSFDNRGIRTLWLTADGLVRVGNSNNSGSMTFERLDYASGAVLDSIALPAEWENSSYWFDPAGRFFLFYEGTSGRLYKANTWWK